MRRVTTGGRRVRLLLLRKPGLRSAESGLTLRREAGLLRREARLTRRRSAEALLRRRKAGLTWWRSTKARLRSTHRLAHRRLTHRGLTKAGLLRWCTETLLRRITGLLRRRSAKPRLTTRRRSAETLLRRITGLLRRSEALLRREPRLAHRRLAHRRLTHRRSAIVRLALRLTVLRLSRRRLTVLGRLTTECRSLHVRWCARRLSWGLLKGLRCALLRTRRLPGLWRGESLLLRWRETARRRSSGNRTTSRNHRCHVTEHRLRRLRRRRTSLHRRHRSSACAARWCVHQHRRAAVRARPSWCRHRFPFDFRPDGIVSINSSQRSDPLLHVLCVRCGAPASGTRRRPW